MTKSWSSDFSYSYYEKIIYSMEKSYRFYLFSEVPIILEQYKIQKVLLRHDVDLVLVKAHEMASLEKEFGIHATYMIMINSPLYSINDPNSIAIIKEIIRMGHEIGLHFDIKSNDEVEPELSNYSSDIINAVDEIESIFNIPIHSISMHRPLKIHMFGPLMIQNLIYSYSQDLMKWYLSELRGRWREGEPLPQLIQPKHHLLQLLIHPFWWGSIHMSPQQRIKQYIKDYDFGNNLKNSTLLKHLIESHIGVYIK